MSLCRELTKLHEEIRKTTLGQAAEFYRDNEPRGEFVLVLAGADPADTVQDAPTLEEAVAAAERLMADGMAPSAAAKQAAAGTPFSKGEIYKEIVKK